MPFGNGTGPAGMGPMTGRAAGYCAGYPVPGFMNPIPGRGFWGWGRGRWAGVAPVYGAPYATPYALHGFQYMPGPQQETDALKGQAKYLEDTLKAVRKRLADVEAEQVKKK